MDKKIVFTGGGTLGHVMPNMYLIEELGDNVEKFYIGSTGIEKGIVEKKIKYYTIPSVKLVRGKIFSNLKIPFVLIDAIIKSKRILKEINPDLVFSKGGYVSLPVVVAAKMLKIPIIAHESDYSFGLANKIILKLCDKMCVNFKNLESINKKIIYTGPIFSKSFENKRKIKFGLNLDENKPTCLIVGGSLGSKKINEVVFPCIKDLMYYFNIIHITGKGNLKIKSYNNYNAFEIRDDMSNLYNIADFVLGRSGAGVTSECYFKKLPMLLIPLQNKATRGDQLENAKYYERLGVAQIIKEAELTPTKLLQEMINFKDKLAVINKIYAEQDVKNGKDIVINLIEKANQPNKSLN